MRVSTQQTITTYQFSFSYTDPNYGNGFTFQVSAQPGFGDAEAFALEEAINTALDKTPSLAPNSGVLKAQVVTTNYQTNPTATPPSFT